MNTLSIDFGTSYSTAAYLNADGTPCPVCFGMNQYNAKYYKIPTIIQYAMSSDGTEHKIVGESALFNFIQSNLSDSSIISKIKTELREKSGYVVNGKTKKSKDIVADILSYIKSVAENNSGCQFTRLILTHPAQYATTKKVLLEEAAIQSGFNAVNLLEEPKAAAYAFVQKHAIPGEKGAIVFDYGGGTIDIAYLWIDSASSISFKFHPVSKEQCGGEYIDIALHNYLAPIFGLDCTYTHPSLLELCNRLKLSFAFKDMEDVMYNQSVFSLSKQKFETAIAPKVNVALSLLSNVISQSKCNNYPIDYVFLNGGSSRLKMVSSAISTLLPDANLLNYGDDDIAVAIGALLFVKRNEINQQDSTPQRNNKVTSINPSLDKIRELYKKSQL